MSLVEKLEIKSLDVDSKLPIISKPSDGFRKNKKDSAQKSQITFGDLYRALSLSELKHDQHMQQVLMGAYIQQSILGGVGDTYNSVYSHAHNSDVLLMDLLYKKAKNNLTFTDEDIESTPWLYLIKTDFTIKLASRLISKYSKSKNIKKCIVGNGVDNIPFKSLLKLIDIHICGGRDASVSGDRSKPEKTIEQQLRQQKNINFNLNPNHLSYDDVLEISDTIKQYSAELKCMYQEYINAAIKILAITDPNQHISAANLVENILSNENYKSSRPYDITLADLVTQPARFYQSTASDTLNKRKAKQEFPQLIVGPIIGRQSIDNKKAITGKQESYWTYDYASIYFHNLFKRLQSTNVKLTGKSAELFDDYRSNTNRPSTPDYNNSIDRRLAKPQSMVFSPTPSTRNSIIENRTKLSARVKDDFTRLQEDDVQSIQIKPSIVTVNNRVLDFDSNDEDEHIYTEVIEYNPTNTRDNNAQYAVNNVHNISNSSNGNISNVSNSSNIYEVPNSLIRTRSSKKLPQTERYGNIYDINQDDDSNEDTNSRKSKSSKRRSQG